VVFAGAGVYSRIKAQREAELLRELVQDSNEVEWLLRSAYQLPLHDTAGEQSLIRQRLSSLQRRLAQSTGRLSGLFLYAIGRGQQALHEFEAAEDSLKGALARDIDLPELHLALGRVLGERYHQQLTAARYSGEPTFFAARKKELEAKLLAPALASLSRSRSAKLMAPEYLEGLVALYQEQYDAGLRSAEVAAAKAPWMYEAAQLQGDILLARGMNRVQHGDYAKAEESLHAAIARYERAADIARSDARVHEALTETWIQLSRLPGKSPADAAAARAAALRAADSTIAAAPEHSSGYTKKAYALFWQALSQYQASEDMQPTLAALRRSALAAIERNPRDAVALDVLGNSYDLAGSDKNDRGQDPRPDFEQAAKYLEAALRVDPLFPWAWNDTAANLQHLGNYHLVSGGDPRESLQKAVQAAERAIRLDPQAVAPYGNALGAYSDWVTYLVESGEDPARLIDEAHLMATRLFALNPRNAEGRRIAGRLELTLASYLFDKGRDPASAIERALRELQESAAIAPDQPDLEQNLATVYQLRARLRASHKQDPLEDLAMSRAYGESCRKHNPELSGCLVAAARCRLEQASWAMEQRLSPVPVLLEAEELASRAVKLNETDHEALYELARARYELLRARRKPQAPGDLDAVLQALNRALHSNPRHSRSYALRAAALVLQGESSTDRNVRQAAVRAAQQSLASAQAINALSVRLHASEIARLPRLSKTPAPMVAPNPLH
jgi:serine/threonine-protein kinase